MAENYKYLLLEIDDDGIALVTINRPDKMNALNGEVLDGLDQIASGLKRNREVKGVIVTGAGEKAFVAGADIGELRKLNNETGSELSKKGQRIFDRIEQFPKPVIAVLNGFALGGGAELAMACHLRIATSSAKIGLPEVTLGLIPGYGGTQRLSRLAGRAKALEMILTGKQIKADEAESIGLVNRVTSNRDEALDEARGLLKIMTANGPVAITKAIKAINAAGSETGYEKEAEFFGELCETQDFKEGTSAFLEKRKPDFKGR